MQNKPTVRRGSGEHGVVSTAGIEGCSLRLADPARDTDPQQIPFGEVSPFPNNGTFWERVRWASSVDCGNAPAKAVLKCLIEHWNPNDVRGAWPSQTTIAAETGLNVRTVIRSLDRLESSGSIVRNTTRRGHTKTNTSYHPHPRLWISQRIEEVGSDRESLPREVGSDRESLEVVTESHTKLKLEVEDKDYKRESADVDKSPPPPPTERQIDWLEANGVTHRPDTFKEAYAQIASLMKSKSDRRPPHRRRQHTHTRTDDELMKWAGELGISTYGKTREQLTRDCTAAKQAGQNR